MKNLKLPKHYEQIVYFLVAAVVVFVRLRYADMPMERDEGEYAYAGSQILRGGFPFKDFYNMKLPGVYYCYALVMGLFGKTVVVVRTSLLVMCLISSFFLMKIGEKWISPQAGWLAGAFYLYISMSFSAQGIIANCEHFVVFFFLATLLAFTYERYFIAGLCAALAVFMKQQATILLCFAFIYFIYGLIINRKQGFLIKKIALASLGFVIPFAAFLAAVWHNGVFESFKFFIIDYARAYIGIQKPHYDFNTLLDMNKEAKELWWAGKVSLALALFMSFFSKKLNFRTPLHPLFLVLFLMVSYLAILPGWYYRPHYHQYFIPALALVMAYGWYAFHIFSKKYKLSAFYAILLIICFARAIHFEKKYLFFDSVDVNLSKMYPVEKFKEHRIMANVIKNTSAPTDTLGMMGHDPEYLFYADRVSASGYMYCYPMIEDQPYELKMAEQFSKEIITTKPKWFVDCFYWFTWEWFDTRIPMENAYNFIKKNYYLRGVLYEDKTMEWNIDSVEQKRRPYAIVFERKDSGQTKPTPLVFE